MVQNQNEKSINKFDNISLTGFRCAKIFNLLLKTPCTYEEINQFLKTKANGLDDISKDSVTLYINTLRAIGCEIKRPSSKNNYKYVLIDHPFKLSLSSVFLQEFLNIRKHLSLCNNWNFIIDNDNFILKFIEIFDKETILRWNKMIKPKTSYFYTKEEIEKIKLLNKYCAKKRRVGLIYISPEKGEKQMEIIARKIICENNTIYLSCLNKETDKILHLRIDRIKDIKTVSIASQEKKVVPIIVKYKLTGTSAYLFEPENAEKIIKKNTNEIIIETKVYNEFNFIQKVLNYGNNCTLISPEHMKEQVLSKLNRILKSYE
ncbi:MAG: WYL domain-containing protein [Candidatus Gastranaerophilales bacterium]|nr:WYL domain-containing protein [Candidatus Gastranaerophilales bacterium]